MNNPYLAPTTDLSQIADDAGTYDPQVFSMGRIGRLRYLVYAMSLSMLLSAVLGILMAALRSKSMVLVMILFYVPALALGIVMAIRRLNDMGHSGWLSIVCLIPFVGLWLVFGRGDEAANNYGPAPSKNTGLVIAGAWIIPIVCVAMMAVVAIPVYQAYVVKTQGVPSQQAPEQAPR